MSEVRFSSIDHATVAEHYLIALAWSSTTTAPNGGTDQHGYPEQVETDSLGYPWAPGVQDNITALIEDWIDRHARLVLAYLETDGVSQAQLGHDLCLTSGHHGVGFWDRDLGSLGDDLTKAAHELPEYGVSLEVWADHDTEVIHIHF